MHVLMKCAPSTAESMACARRMFASAKKDGRDQPVVNLRAQMSAVAMVLAPSFRQVVQGNASVTMDGRSLTAANKDSR